MYFSSTGASGLVKSQNCTPLMACIAAWRPVKPNPCGSRKAGTSIF
jgi:hypothetical protein